MKLNKKAPGPDNLNNSLLKGARHSINEIIAHLFNISVHHSFIPTQWKQANIVPIPKTKCPTTTNDFRPVALTSSLCKVLERIITKEILNTTKDIWPTNKQFGFLPERSTMDALIQVIEDWRQQEIKKRQYMQCFLTSQKHSNQ